MLLSEIGNKTRTDAKCVFFIFLFLYFFILFFFPVLDNERVVELLQAIKEKTVTLDTIRHAPHPLCKSPPTQISSKLRANEHKHTQLVIPEVMLKWC